MTHAMRFLTGLLFFGLIVLFAWFVEAVLSVGPLVIAAAIIAGAVVYGTGAVVNAIADRLGL